ncbi:hypothetical protein TNCV_3160741 [Trichonephila clavipes]|nr:hypothetical protein TNCV_3160741 [Trichonephila clavipes]
MDLDISKDFCSGESGWRASLPIVCWEVRIMAQKMAAQVEGVSVKEKVQKSSSTRIWPPSHIIGVNVPVEVEVLGGEQATRMGVGTWREGVANWCLELEIGWR